MESQHFSHQHLLFSLQLEEGEKIICKACERLIFEPFHGCIACNHYLHDQCLNTPRWLEHPSHYSHSLVLLPTQTYSTGSYSCRACGFSGNAFSLSCAECEFDLHVYCANLPSTVLLDGHSHELELAFESPYDETTTSICDVCASSLNHKHWVYYCADCDFATHLGCATSNKLQKVSNHYKHAGSAIPLPVPTIEEGGQLQQNRSMNNQAPKRPGTTQSSSSITEAATNSLKETSNEMRQTELEMMKFHSELAALKIARKGRKAALKLI